MGLVRHAWASQTFSKITNCQYLWERLSYFVYLLHVVTHPGKLHYYHVVLVRYVPARPKFSEITNHQYLWRGLSVDLLRVVICILLYIHWSYQNLLFWAGIFRHRLSANQIVKCFKLKKIENYMRYQVDCLFPLKLQKISCYFRLCRQILLVYQLENFLLFTCLTYRGSPLLHCTCYINVFLYRLFNSLNTLGVWLLKFTRLNQSETLFCIVSWLFVKTVLFVDDFVKQTCFTNLVHILVMLFVRVKRISFLTLVFQVLFKLKLVSNFCFIQSPAIQICANSVICYLIIEGY